MRLISMRRDYVWEFEDADGDTVQARVDATGGGSEPPRPATLELAMREDCNVLGLTQADAKALIPLLQHFAETGELPESAP